MSEFDTIKTILLVLSLFASLFIALIIYLFYLLYVILYTGMTSKIKMNQFKDQKKEEFNG